MVLDPKCVRRAQQPYAAIRADVTTSTLEQEGARLLEAVGLWFGLHEFLPGGPPLRRYLVVGTGTRLQVDVGYPVAAAALPMLLDAVDGHQNVHVEEVPFAVRTGWVPEGMYAWVMHEGELDDLQETRDMLLWWVTAHGYELDRWHTDRGAVWGGRIEYDLTGGPPEGEEDQVSRIELAYRLA
ncbi:hypothetical protein ACGIF2_10560 [Cellulomonas sp. P22]|uniref:hypothetical protein n=1 Tax=Cellulomonas sp. P22 TaxID=3373189 RepID=UPI0037A0C18A